LPKIGKNYDHNIHPSAGLFFSLWNQFKQFSAKPYQRRGPFLTSPLGAKFDPMVKVVPQEWILSPFENVCPKHLCPKGQNVRNQFLKFVFRKFCSSVPRCVGT
jgi:hypothetical protein